jgi:hypothetical protein
MTGIRIILAACLFVCSIAMSSTQNARGAACPGEACTKRSDRQCWCCVLRAESSDSTSCTYFNDSVYCRVKDGGCVDVLLEERDQ